MPEDKERKFAKDFLEKWSRAEREGGPADEALEEVDRALAERPDDPGLWFRRGSLLTDLERWDEALESFRKAEALDPTFPRLYVGLSYVLARLGRAEEAAAAQRRALEAATGGKPSVLEPEAEVQRTLEGLAEELAKEEREAEAVRGLEELGEIAGEPEAPGPAPEAHPGEDEFRRQLAAWEAEGYDVSPLRDVMEREPDRTRTAFFQFEQNVRKVQVLRETVDALDPAGLEEDIARIRSLFRAPYQIWRIEAEMATLMDKAGARDRLRRAARVTPPGGPAARARVTRPAPPAGRVNGLVGPPGRVNGQAGRVNGLVNGVQRARAGLTNGLTNGLGFTNGLGGKRFALEARARRGRLLLIPAVAVVLLSVALLVPPETPPPEGGIAIDGTFEDWSRAPGRYTQPTSTANPDVDLREYRAFFQDDRLSVYARVSGTAFADSTGLDVAYAFLDVDGDAQTGYDEAIVGAEFLIEISGGNGTVESAASWRWEGTDRGDWAGWRSAGLPVLAAASGSELEFQVDVEDQGVDPGRIAVRLTLDDQAGGMSASEVAFGPRFGALRVTQSAAAEVLPSGGLRPLLNLTFTSVGEAVAVSGVVTDPPLVGFRPFNLTADETRTISLQIDTTGRPAETLLAAELVAVEADRPVSIRGAPARAYVERRPAGHVVDGLFGAEWGNVTIDGGPAPDDPNVDILEFAGESQGGTAFAYVQVLGTALGGGDAAWRRTRPQQGPPSEPNPPGPPEVRRGDDLVRVYYDAGAVGGGMPIGGIVADAFLEVRGRHGRVRDVRSFTWEVPTGWIPNGTAEAEAAGAELEASLALPGVDLRGAAFVIEAIAWHGDRDWTEVGGVRGTRSSPEGTTFLGRYEAFLPARGDGLVRFGTADGPTLSWPLPRWLTADGAAEAEIAVPRGAPLEVSDGAGAYRDAFEGLTAHVRYESGIAGLKETILLATPVTSPGDAVLVEFPIRRSDGLMVRVTGEPSARGLRVVGDIQYVDGRGLALTLGKPWAEDADGVRVDLAYLLRDDRIAIEIPAAWLALATYPVRIDPTVTYQLENDNSGSNDPGEQFGYSVAVGDFNGDGYADAAVGAPLNNRGSNLHGYAYVFYGPFSADDSSPDLEINGTTNNARFGYSVAAGKFNGDVYWDLLVGRLSTPSFPGDTAIYFGGPSGPDTTADVVFTSPPSPQFFGWWVAAGNLDNANYDDVIIGEPSRDNDGGSATQDGVAYVYMSPFGSTESSADYRLLPSTNANGRFGRAIAVGKIDSDAYPDVVVGEPLEANGGRVHFFKGSHFTTGSGDVSPDAVLSAQASGEQFGAALSVGTLNGDAYADLLVGAPNKNSGSGAAYVFLANSNGTGLTTGASPDLTIPNQSSGESFGTSVLVVDFDDDGTNGVLIGAPTAAAGGTNRGRAYWFDAPLADQTPDETISGGQDGERLGHSLAAGRFSSDTRTIALIGAYLWDDGSESDSGRVLVAAVPEPAPMLVAVTILIGIGGRSLQRRRLVRKR